jgi:peptidoglycan hydrolase-like protein with peptidoglycan-binding domain
VAPPTVDPTIRVTQVLLNEAGVGSIGVDGFPSDAFTVLLITFQNANGLPATGFPDAATLHALKIAALVKTLVGTWQGTSFSGGTALGTFIDVIHPNGSTNLTFDFLPCTGTGQFFDFDGLHYTTVAVVPLDAACTPPAPVRTIVTIIDANTLSYNYGT